VVLSSHLAAGTLVTSDTSVQLSLRPLKKASASHFESERS
jgi:hypothetical protein